MSKDLTYLAFVGAARALMAAQNLNITVIGEENVPERGGGVITMNHTGYLDFVFGGLPFRKYRRYVRYMAKKEVFKKPIAGLLMRAMRHIPVDRIDGSVSYRTALERLRDGDLVGIFPEGTISRSFEIKPMRTGAIRLAAEAGVPVIPVVIFGSQRLWSKGPKKSLHKRGLPIYVKVLKPWTPAGVDAEAETAELRRQLAEGLESLWGCYLRDHGEFPQGEAWVPARFGGSAPTLEEATIVDTAVENERYRIRKLSREIDELTSQLKVLTSKIRQRGTEQMAIITAKAEAQKTEASARMEEIEASLRRSLSELGKDTQLGLREGAERIKAANLKLRENVDEFYRQVPSIRESSAYLSMEDSMTKLVSKALIIRDSLPHKRSPLAQLPGSVVVDLEKQVDFSVLRAEGVQVIEAEDAESADFSELQAPVVYLGYRETKLAQAKLGVTLGDAPFKALTAADRVIAEPQELVAVILGSSSEGK